MVLLEHIYPLLAQLFIFLPPFESKHDVVRFDVTVDITHIMKVLNGCDEFTPKSNYLLVGKSKSVSLDDIDQANSKSLHHKILLLCSLIKSKVYYLR